MNIFGNTAIFHAAYKNPNINVLKYFVEVLNCNVHAKNKNNYSVLENALQISY